MQTVPFRAAFCSSAFLVLLGFLVVFLLDQFSSAPLLFTQQSLFYSLLIGSALGFVLFVIVFIAMKALTNYFVELNDISQQLYAFFHHFNYFQIIVISILAGVGEELVFRGLLQNYLVYLINPQVGIVLAALIFGILHCLNRVYVVFAVAVGLLIGCLYYMTNDLLLVMILHAVYDFCAFTAIIKFPHLFDIDVANNYDSVL